MVTDERTEDRGASYFVFFRRQSIIRVNKSRRVRWMRHAARMKEISYAYKISVGKLKGR
jgi:hypothetical protein